MSELSKELDRYAAQRLSVAGRVFGKLTMRASDIDTWIDTADIVGVEQMDGWTRLQRRRGGTWAVNERAETVLAMMGVSVVEHVPEF